MKQQLTSLITGSTLLIAQTIAVVPAVAQTGSQPVPSTEAPAPAKDKSKATHTTAVPATTAPSTTAPATTTPVPATKAMPQSSNRPSWGGSGGSSGSGSNPGSSWGGSGNSGWNSGGNSSGSLTCESWNYQYRRCPANTRNNVELTRRIAGNCREGRTWGYDRNSIWVDGGCRATFRYGMGGGGGGGGNWGQGYAGQIRCESWNYAYRFCRANTGGRVDLIRTVAGTCQRGRSWGYDNSGIWVNNGCRADFAYGRGNFNPGESGNSNNNNTGEVVAGVAIAAGLLALLGAATSSNRSTSSTAAPLQVNEEAPPARIVADLSRLPADQRPSVQTCLDEAARQIGATGGTEVRLEQIKNVSRISNGWSVRAQLVSVYPDQQRSVPINCRADGDQLMSLDFID